MAPIPLSFHKYRLTQQELRTRWANQNIHCQAGGGERKGSAGMMTAIARVLGIDLDQLRRLKAGAYRKLSTQVTDSSEKRCFLASHGLA